ncbi:MAG: hypothetical protein U9Q34_07040 [Elusimicrobiota bacterium]|nr:hypothetical protein [Elusimicrobiota bacterium]
MKKTITLAIVCGAFFTAGCGNNQTAEKTQPKQKQEVKKSRPINILETREGLETRLSEIGLIIYPGAKFKRIKTSNATFDGGHYISYDLPEVTSESKAKVKKFYYELFKKFEEDGWKNQFNVWREKGNHQFTFAHMYMENPPMHSIGITYKDKTE